MKGNFLLLLSIILFSSLTGAWAQNLVRKPDFGTAASPAVGASQGNANAATDFITQQTPTTNLNSTNGLYRVADTYTNSGGTAFYDHTQGGSPGAFLGVNGPTIGNTNDIVWQQTITVQPNQNYTFSYWQRNLSTTNPATIQLETQGNVVTTAASVGPTTTATGTNWVQFTAPTINSGANTQLTIRLRDTNHVSSGNVFGLDDIAFYLQGAGAITGSVFEDVNYGGGAGRPRATAASSATSSGFTAAITRPLATVELYSGTGTYLASTTTDMAGQYTFPGLAPDTYTVRVVSSTVTSARAGGTAPGLLPVVTFQNGATNQVGGPNPALPDAPANPNGTIPTPLAGLTTTSQAVEALTTVAVTTATTSSGVDFGFNFDLVVNTKDAGQGSLRQFITNATALGNESLLAQAGFYRNQLVGANPVNKPLPPTTESSIFLIPNGTAVAGLRAFTGGGPASQLNAGGVAVITPATALPGINGPTTALNGWTQSYNVGNTNDVTLGAGGAVGTSGALLNQLNGPEIQLTSNLAVAIGVDLLSGADGSSVMGLAIYGFGSAGTGTLDSNTGANIRTTANNVTLAQNVVGSAATAFASPSTPTNADNIRLTGGTGIVVVNNLIGFSNSKGIAVNLAVAGATIMGNEVRGNGQAGATYDGIDIQGNGAVVTNNLFVNNTGQGIDSYRSTGNNTITGNTVSGNGRGSSSGVNETPGVRIYGAGNTIYQNTISGNYGAGILLEGLTNGGTTAAASTTLISQNSIFNNGSVKSANNTAASGQLGIDLAANGDNELAGTAPFVTLNSTATAGANGLLNYPILQMARINGSNLVVSGLAAAGVTVEVFVATPNTLAAGATTGNNFGQGSTYLGSAVTTSSGITASYGPGAVNGFAQGSGTTVNYFIIVIPLTTAQRTMLANGTLITSTATLSNSTSEFSGNVAITPGPSAFSLSNLNVGTGAASNALNPGITVPQAASDPNSTIASFTIFPTTNGTLLYNGAAIPAAGQVIPAANTNQLTFQPTAGFAGNAMFSFTATSAAGIVSNQAVYTIPVITSGNGFVANDDGLDAAQNMATSGNLILNDTNTSNTTTFSVNQVAAPTHGTLTLTAATGVYTYTPATGYLGADSFQYQVCTTAGTTTTCSNTATVSINVYDPALVCSSATGPNLLVNPGFESGNTSFSSAYNFIARPATAATGSPNGLYPEGTYAVDADATYYHKSFTGTPRSGGKLMIINGAANLSQVYAQVINVVPGRYYTFSGYAISVNEASPAVLGFVINGKSASISTTLPTTRNSYVQFSGVWYSGTSRTATFEVRDINRDAGGNDFGLDDLYFGTCNANLLAVTKNNPSVSSQAAATNLVPMEATLTSTGVSIASVVIQTLPAAGTLRLGGANGPVVTAGQVISYDQRGTLYYAPVAGSAGDQSFTYIAIDSEGAGSGNTATFTIPVTAAPLPVVLTSFTAQAAGTAAQLAWTTATELANAYFEVERSTSGQPNDFVALGRIAGKGTTAVTTAYQFVDRGANAAGALVYYRLRQVDQDGTSTYSPVRVVLFGQSLAGALSLYPNPSAGSTDTNLDLSSLPTTATYQVHLLDATGRTVRQWSLPGGQAQPLDVAGLANGTYLLLVSGNRADGSTLRQVLHLTKE